MEKSNNSSDNADGKNHKNEEKATTSKEDSVNPLRVSHNMNDLKMLDFNSADDVRQTMKAVLAIKLSQGDREEIGAIKTSNNVIDVDSAKAVGNPKNSTNNLHAKNENNYINKQNKNTQLPKNNMKNIRKRPGRPPKAGSSIKFKKASVTALYIGKLSNVVAFRNRFRELDSESESDNDSVMSLY
ncbi:translation initiation factor IF-2-like [Galleria mellonella]|uniref:Translation initiation factor IF-2-like n=1 Tax=Galleria mellonella TaxID=7137 RepID=A0A6J3BZP6_GALME|nr:translation initiation factor IF-2-like [Galleria mellonella]